MNTKNAPINTLTELFESAFSKWGCRPFLSFIDGQQAYSYRSFGEKVDYVVRMLGQNNIGPGDRVAILSENMPHWGVVFCASTTTGRVAVPIMPGSSPYEIENILTHSGASILFVSAKLQEKVLSKVADKLSHIIRIDDLSIIAGNTMSQSPISTPNPKPETMAVIVYTSGTSGHAKGVMLSHKNLCHNVQAAYRVQSVTSHDRWISVLPLAHTYELALGFLLPVYAGGSITYLYYAPAPAILFKAMKIIRPTVVMSVPLIIEKVCGTIKNWIDTNPRLLWMQKNTAFLMTFVMRIKLRKETGGRIKFWGIGGSKLKQETEVFLAKLCFPYAIIYGMTETAPLICVAAIGQTKVGYAGTPCLDVKVRLEPINPESTEGEILVKGPNVMLGYFRDAELTASVIDKDGWLHTGDIAIKDEDGCFAIIGRIKNVIIGASGENIYPEEIEQVINSYPGISASLIVERENRLVALVNLEEGFSDMQFLQNSDILEFVNARVNTASKISRVEIVKEPFIRSAMSKTRRFLYI